MQNSAGQKLPCGRRVTGNVTDLGRRQFIGDAGVTCDVAYCPIRDTLPGAQVTRLISDSTREEADLLTAEAMGAIDTVIGRRCDNTRKQFPLSSLPFSAILYVIQRP